MMLCLDVGNSQIYGGVFDEDKLALQFRRSSKGSFSSDEVGTFLRSVLRENDIEPSHIDKIAVCTVVPDMLHSIRNACLKYFKTSPFVLQAGVRTGLNIRYRNPLELGADRIANAIAATALFPKRNLVLIDMGTATTFCAVSAKREFLGGSIIPGIRIAMTSLESNTAKLPNVEIVQTTEALGRSTVEGIQAGLYYSTLGAIREIVQKTKQEAFPDAESLVIGTGGFAGLYKDQKLFDIEIPDLILQGLFLAYQMNHQEQRGAYAHSNAEI
jgi:type III pantothenate kinase